MHNLLKQANKAVAKCLLDLIEIAAKIVSDNKILILQKTGEHKKNIVVQSQKIIKVIMIGMHLITSLLDQ